MNSNAARRNLTTIVLDAARHVLTEKVSSTVTAMPGTAEHTRLELSRLLLAGQTDRRTQLAWARADTACTYPVLPAVPEARAANTQLALAI